MKTKSIREQQLAFLDWEFGVFFHFGIRTFYEGHRDWDLQAMPLEGFNPTELNCERWIADIKEAGAAYAILVCKHHDGFANWPSRYTEYSVARTPWKNGQGDVVREFVDACRKYDVKVGLYYSPAEFGSKNKSAQEYDDYFINQISELLTGYGRIDYLWFDGCGSENHQYDTGRITRAIRSMQPDILIFNMWDPDTRWAGNESGVAQSPNRNWVSDLDFSVQTIIKEELDQIRFLPAECDCRLRLQNWFYSDHDEDTIKSVDELIGLYELSVGRGANLLLNVGPDRRGLLPEKDSRRIKEFGAEIRRRYARPLAESFIRADGFYSLQTEEPILVNQVVAAEDMAAGEKTGAYRIQIHPFAYGAPITVFRGEIIGHKAICSFPAVLTKRIDLVLGDGAGDARIVRMSAYRV